MKQSHFYILVLSLVLFLRSTLIRPTSILLFYSSPLLSIIGPVGHVYYNPWRLQYILDTVQSQTRQQTCTIQRLSMEPQPVSPAVVHILLSYCFKIQI